MKKNNFKSLMQAAVLICTPLVIASCDDVFGDVDNPIPSHLTVSQADVNLELHAAHPEKATFIRKGIAATGAQLVYSSSDEKVATVDANGKITGVGEGDCKIIVKATGLDSNGKQTYQEAEESFTVNVKDYRARIELIEGAEIPVFNSADASLAEIDLSKVIKVWPANVNIKFTEAVPSSGVINIVTDGITGQQSIKLKGTPGTAKVTAAIDPTEAKVNKKLFETYENKSFKDNQVTKEFEITVKEGVAYISGFDAKGQEVRTTMFKDFNGEKYTDLSDKLMDAAKTTYVGSDVTLDAGWYYLDRDLAFPHNIRANGNVNIILNGNSFSLASKDIMDESATKTHKLNFFREEKTTPTATFQSIKDFKEVNVCGVTITSPVTAVENVTVDRGTIGDLTGTGNVNVIDGTVGALTGFASVTLAKGTAKTAKAASLTTIGSAIISEGATVTGALKGITTLTIDKAKSVGNIGGTTAADKVTNLTINEAVTIGNLNNVGTAIITKTPTKGLNNITDLTLNNLNAAATGSLTLIGTVTINKLTADKYFPTIQANAVNIVDGTISADKIIGWKNETGNPAQATVLTVSGGALTVDNFNGTDDYAVLGDVTMTGGKLTVTGPKGDNKFAISGAVSVSGGEFLAYSPNYHAVSGALTGTFEGSSDSTNGTDGTWTAVTGSNKPKWLRNKK